VNESTAREQICRVGKSLFDRGYVHATAGNISCRIDDGHSPAYLITPTDACLGFLDPARLSKVDLHGNPISGDKASKTIVLHRRIYEASASTRFAAGCVIHTHSTHCVQLTLAHDEHQRQTGELLPALTPYFVMKVGHVPLIPYHRPGDPVAGERVSQCISEYHDRGQSIRAVMLDRLGPNVWGPDPMATMATLEELEETAKLYHQATTRPAPLAAEQIEDLRQVFGACW
jgi:ribulose-5-phosphate 4-epimerase/fuculose-1-phosphate aldolase